MTNVLCTCLLVINVKSNTLVKLLTTFGPDGIITNLRVEVLKEEKSVCKNICINILKVKRHTEFLDDVSIILIDKTDGSNPTKRENYWMRTLKTVAPYGLNVEDNI